jgi:DNA-binding NarL/FixJ family response regulator
MQETIRKYTILLVEHEWPIIRSVKDALEGDHELVYLGVVENRRDLEEFIVDKPPDLVLVDLKLPVHEEKNGLLIRENRFEEGLWIISRIKELSPHSLVIPFSDYVPDDAQLSKEALKAGADAFLPKQDGPGGAYDWPEWFRYKLRAIAKQSWQMDARLARAIADEETGNRKQTDGLDLLSDRQMDVLKLLAEGKTDDEIAEILVIEQPTVRTHISNIMHKLQTRGRKETINRFNQRDERDSER